MPQVLMASRSDPDWFTLRALTSLGCGLHESINLTKRRVLLVSICMSHRIGEKTEGQAEGRLLLCPVIEMK